MAAVVTPGSVARATPLEVNLIEDGSFESGGLGSYTVTHPNSVSLLNWSSSDGEYAVRFNYDDALPLGVISQNITTVVGRKYTVAFDYGILGFVGQSQSLIVGFTGNTPQKVTAEAESRHLGPDYLPFSLEFTATATTSTISFSDDPANDHANVDSGLDNIRVTAENAAGTAPTAITLSSDKVKEGLPAGSFVGQLSTTDADAGDTHTYSLVGGDAADFALDGRILRTDNSFDAGLKGSYNVTVRATDSLGLFVDQAFNITVLEATKPVVAISTPAANAKVFTSSISAGGITGTTSDNTGVTSVKVRLSRKRNNVNQYWNGTDFGTAQSTVAADLNGNAWTLTTNAPPAGKLDGGAYNIQVFALDAAGNKSAYAERNFTLNSDFSAPTVTLTSPTASQKVTTTAFVNGAAQGTATDDTSVTAVKVRLSRKEGTVTKYWNGTDFVTAISTVDADLTGTTWKLLANVPAANKLTAGAYGIAVYSLDAAGNKSATVSRSFTLASDFTAPTVIINTPSQNELIDINDVTENALNGGASDNKGVVSVKLKLQRKRGTVTQYWNGTNFTTTVATFDATLSEIGDTNVGWGLTSAIPASELDKGAYTLYATAYDAAGNFKTSASRIFYVTGTASTPEDAASDAGSSAGRS